MSEDYSQFNPADPSQYSQYQTAPAGYDTMSQPGQIMASAGAPSGTQPTGAPGQGNALPLQSQQTLDALWAQQIQDIEAIQEFKTQELPLARIKKIMKSDEEVKMISAEAPILFARACELFILELTVRAWAQTEDTKRRTLQKSDISGAISKNEMYDFLIDIVPREDSRNPRKEDSFALRAQMGITPEAVQHHYLMYSLQQQAAQQQGMGGGPSTPAPDGKMALPPPPMMGGFPSPSPAKDPAALHQQILMQQAAMFGRPGATPQQSPAFPSPLQQYLLMNPGVAMNPQVQQLLFQQQQQQMVSPPKPGQPSGFQTPQNPPQGE